jgi:hypothetical protein
MAIKNNLILSILLFGNCIIPNYFNDKIVKYKIAGDEYYKYLVLLSINDEIQNKYNIDMISIGLKLYDNYKKVVSIDDDVLSEISDLSDLSDLNDHITSS